MSDYKQYIESYEGFPKEGVMFRDFTPLTNNPEAFRSAINEIKEHYKNKKITKIAAVESKGFVIGASLAYEMRLPLIFIRKPGLIPGEIECETFIKEYGIGEYQIKKGVVNKDDFVLIVYDIMAGPGASKAAINLVEKNKATVAGCAYIIELEYLHGREELNGYNLFSLVKIENYEN